MTQRIRRLSRSAKPEGSAKHLIKAKELLQSIANLQIEISALEHELTDSLELLESVMQEGKLTTVSEGGATAAFVRSAGKSQKIIDARKFFDKVDEEDFFAAITVLVTKAKELLGQKELDRITKTIPAKPGEEKLKITYEK